MKIEHEKNDDEKKLNDHFEFVNKLYSENKQLKEE